MRFNSIILTAFLASMMSMQVSSSSIVDAGVNGIMNDPVSRSLDADHAVGSTSIWRRNTGMTKRRHVKRCGKSTKAKSKFAHKKDDHKDKSKEHHKHKDDKKKDDKKDHKKDDKKENKDKQRTSNSNNDQSSDKGGIIGAAKGLLGLKFGGECSNPHASDKYPNGNINFLNCGLSKSDPTGRWSPPDVKMSQLKFVSSAQAAKSGVFGSCSKYKSAFDNAASQTGVPAVLLMAFAMQESSCNPSAKGGNGEIGMMQLTPDKCTNANCWDATTNIEKGAEYFKSQLDAFGGNALQAIGAYNGWQKGLTYDKATNQQYGCHSQNNLDYLNQMLNGWSQGKNGASMTVYNNLASC